MRLFAPLECHAASAQVKLLRQDIQRALRQAEDSHALAELKLAKAVVEGHGPGGDLRKLLKQPTPALLKLLLGQHCNVMTLQVATQTGSNCIISVAFVQAGTTLAGKAAPNLCC